MDRQEHITMARNLLELADLNRDYPQMGHMLAGRWASGAFVHAMMAHLGMESLTTDVPAEIYVAAVTLDREDGGGERWRQAAFAAYELSQVFYFGSDLMTVEEMDRKNGMLKVLTGELLERLAPGGEGAPSP